jgi:hypothetical protein
MYAFMGIVGFLVLPRKPQKAENRSVRVAQAIIRVNQFYSFRAPCQSSVGEISSILHVYYRNVGISQFYRHFTEAMATGSIFQC